MKSRNKDKKTHENIIGKIIYGFLLFMPLLAIGVTCAYAIFNKNAYKSYSYTKDIVNFNGSNDDYNFTMTSVWVKILNNGRLDNQSGLNFVNTKTYDLKYNDTIFYYWKLQGITNTAYRTAVYSDSTTYQTTGSSNRKDLNNYQYLYGKAKITYDHYGTQIFLYGGGSQVLNGNLINFGFIKLNDYDLQTKTDLDIFNIVYQQENKFFYQGSVNYEYNEGKNLDNVFYYSIDKIQQSPLFNWAEDSAIYTGMTTTCNTLNITTPFIPLLMTYWLIISVIYILYDIILVILHIFHKKIHQLEDSF